MENTQVGPFLIVRKLGTSRRQKIYHARQTEQNREVALKFIRIPPTTPWPKALDKIQREVNELQKLHHPSLVEVFGAGVHEEQIFFATELVEGESLSAILSRRGRLTIDLVVEYGRQIAEVLRYLHSKDLIHSKLTPDKILVTANHKIKISDLRLNRAKRRRWDDSQRRELELAAYMAPEQFTEGATEKSDFYALGVMLYEMLTGKLPYPPETLGRMTRMKLDSPVPSVATHLMNCPVWLDRTVSQMLSPNPKHRPHSARAIALGFEEIKNIDATQQAAVVQMAGGFSPLNAGKDKTEAKRLLGKKKRKPNKQHALPFHQRVPFQLAALLLIGVFTIFILWPPSDESIILDARAMIATNDSGQWSEARINLEPIIKRGGEFSDEAELLYYTARRKTLVAHAERGVATGLQNDDVLLFGQGVKFEQEGNDAEAHAVFADLIQRIDPAGKQRHVHQESLQRLAALENRTKSSLPTNPSDLIDLVGGARNASSPKQLLDAHRQLTKITQSFAGVDGYEVVVRLASEQLQLIKQRIEDRATPQELPISNAP